MEERRRFAARFVLIGAAMAAALAGAVWPLIGSGAPDEEAVTGALAALVVICAGLVHLWMSVDGRIVRPLRSEAEAQRRRLEAAVRDLDEGVVVCTGDHRVVLCNRAAARTLDGALEVGDPIGAALDPAAVKAALSGLAAEDAPAAARLEDPSGRVFRISRAGEDGGYVITLPASGGDGRQAVPGGHVPV